MGSEKPGGNHRHCVEKKTTKKGKQTRLWHKGVSLRPRAEGGPGRPSACQQCPVEVWPGSWREGSVGTAEAPGLCLLGLFPSGRVRVPTGPRERPGPHGASSQISFPPEVTWCPALRQAGWWGSQEEEQALPLGPHRGDRSSPKFIVGTGMSRIVRGFCEDGPVGWAVGGIWKTGGVRLSGRQERGLFRNKTPQKNRLEDA